MNLYNLLLYGSLSTIAISGMLVITGLIFIRFGHKGYHKYAMSFASGFAMIFVILYLTRTSLYPHTPYTGGHRVFYFSVLWSHTIFSAVNFPLVIYTIYLAVKERFERHKYIAPFTAGVWIYVAVTGWMIRFFL